MASSPNQFYLFATQIASLVILIGIATISVLAFCPSKSIIGETFRSLPVARKLSFGTQLVALQVAFLLLIQSLFPSFFGCPSEFAVSSAPSPHWSAHLYGVAWIAWALYNLCMQEATYWLTSAKWKKKKEEMAAKAKAIGDMEEQLANLTERIEALERVYFEVA